MASGVKVPELGAETSRGAADVGAVVGLADAVCWYFATSDGVANCATDGSSGGAEDGLKPVDESA
jgi:hypothetical protein